MLDINGDILYIPMECVIIR